MLRKMCKCCVRREPEKYYIGRILTGEVTKVTKKQVEHCFIKVTKTVTCTECGNEWQFSRLHM